MVALAGWWITPTKSPIGELSSHLWRGQGQTTLLDQWIKILQRSVIYSQQTCFGYAGWRKTLLTNTTKYTVGLFSLLASIFYGWVLFFLPLIYIWVYIMDKFGS
jgi:hypothetical protein